MSKKKASVWRYLKEAFLFRWNLLVFGGAMAAAVFSPAPEVVVPLVAAAEVAYLGGLATLPRFQAAIDARQRREDKQAGGGTDPEERKGARQRLLDVLGSLDGERRNRFLRLRARCVEMQRLAITIRGEAKDETGLGHELRTPSLDKLLWVFLKLLLAQQAVDRFLRGAGAEDLQKQQASLQQRLADAQAKKKDRIVKSLTDALATNELRMSNLETARGNHEFITHELDRIEQKIHAVMEMAVSHQDPDELSIEVDAIADGMQQTEATIRELQAITGLSSDADATPEILGGDLTETAR